MVSVVYTETMENTLTLSQVKDLCPAAYDDLVAQNADDPSMTPLESLTFWLAPDEEFGDLVKDHPGHVLCLQDPNDGANVSLMWDGDAWG